MAKPATNVASFGSILQGSMADVERPKPVPTGHYVSVLIGQPRFDKSTRKGTEFVEFTHKLIEALDDVDEDALKEMGGLKDKTIRNTYYLTEEAKYRLKDFLIHCGVADEDSDVSFSEAIAETPGKQVIVHIKHRPNEDGSAIFANVAGTAPVEE